MKRLFAFLLACVLLCACSACKRKSARAGTGADGKDRPGADDLRSLRPDPRDAVPAGPHRARASGPRRTSAAVRQGRGADRHDLRAGRSGERYRGCRLLRARPQLRRADAGCLAGREGRAGRAGRGAAVLAGSGRGGWDPMGAPWPGHGSQPGRRADRLLQHHGNGRPGRHSLSRGGWCLRPCLFAGRDASLEAGSTRHRPLFSPRRTAVCLRGRGRNRCSICWKTARSAASARCRTCSAPASSSFTRGPDAL